MISKSAKWNDNRRENPGQHSHSAQKHPLKLQCTHTHTNSQATENVCYEEAINEENGFFLCAP